MRKPDRLTNQGHSEKSEVKLMQKGMKLLVMSAVMTAMMIYIGTSAYADEVKTGEVTGSVVNLREAPTTEAQVLTSVAQGGTVAVLGEEDSGWYKISYDGDVGYMSADYVEVKQEAEPVSGYVTGSYVNVRKAADSSAAVLGGLYKGAEVEINGLENGWYKISNGSLEGYMSADYVAVGEAPKTSEGEAVAEIAKRYVGYRYRYGGTSPSTGFDCSGLVTYVFRQYNGYTFKSRTSLYLDGVRVTYSELQPGDLVFFDTAGRGSITHVGIYLGNGQMIHAPNSRSCVKIVSMTPGSYYYSTYKGARRIV